MLGLSDLVRAGCTTHRGLAGVGPQLCFGEMNMLVSSLSIQAAVGAIRCDKLVLWTLRQMCARFRV